MFYNGCCASHDSSYSLSMEIGAGESEGQVERDDEDGQGGRMLSYFRRWNSHVRMCVLAALFDN